MWIFLNTSLSLLLVIEAPGGIDVDKVIIVNSAEHVTVTAVLYSLLVGLIEGGKVVHGSMRTPCFHHRIEAT